MITFYNLFKLRYFVYFYFKDKEFNSIFYKFTNLKGLRIIDSKGFQDIVKTYGRGKALFVYDSIITHTFPGEFLKKIVMLSFFSSIVDVALSFFMFKLYKARDMLRNVVSSIKTKALEILGLAPKFNCYLQVKALEILGADKAELALKFTAWLQVEALKVLGVDKAELALKFDESVELKILNKLDGKLSDEQVKCLEMRDSDVTSCLTGDQHAEATAEL